MDSSERLVDAQPVENLFKAFDEWMGLELNKGQISAYFPGEDSFLKSLQCAKFLKANTGSPDVKKVGRLDAEAAENSEKDVRIE